MSLEAPEFYRNPNLPCKQVSPEIMYPEAGDINAEAISRSICLECTAQQVCLDWAISRREGMGTWGAKTATERRTISRKIIRNHYNKPNGASTS